MLLEMISQFTLANKVFVAVKEKKKHKQSQMHIKLYIYESMLSLCHTSLLNKPVFSDNKKSSFLIQSSRVRLGSGTSSVTCTLN